jgi:hypothetical protein
MVKKSLLIFLLLCSFAIGTELDDKIRSFVSIRDYQHHKNLITSIFRNETRFYKNDNIDTIKVLRLLKSNGLLSFIFEFPQKQYIEFRAGTPSVLLLKNVTQALNGLGYSFFISKHIELDEKRFVWKIEYESQNAIDPLLLIAELSKTGCDVFDVSKSKDRVWTYEIDTRNMVLDNAIVIGSNQEVKLHKRVSDYYLKINTDSKNISISSNPKNSWYPYIAFFDKKLNVIKVFKKQTVTKHMVMNIPESTIYIKISDLYMLNNIKRGLNITVKD